MSGTRLVFVTQIIDPENPPLGFVTGFIKALSTRFDELVVIANQVNDIPSDLGAEVVSLGKEHGAGQMRRGLRYERAVRSVIKRVRPHAFFAHMCPIYLSLAAPICKASGVPMLLWFAHPANTTSLAVAERLTDRVLTAYPGSYPRQTPKLRSIGHGIDIDRFPLLPTEERDGPFRLLSLGRTAWAKGYPAIIEAVRILRDAGQDVTLRIVGASMNSAETEHRAKLEASVAEWGLGDAVRIGGSVSRDEYPLLFRDADAFVGGNRVGTVDKVVLEAMASGRPAIVSNPVFWPLLGGHPVDLTYPQDDAAVLAERIRTLAATSRSEREAIGSALRGQVERGHSVGHWADQVLENVLALDGNATAARTVETNREKR